ncbi:hypothetical protein GEMRC1_004426 [Eukaryota sp. GEM-RC1]
MASRWTEQSSEDLPPSSDSDSVEESPVQHTQSDDKETSSTTLSSDSPTTEQPAVAVTYPITELSVEEQEAALQKAEEEARTKFGNLSTNVAAFQRRKLRKRFDSADFFKQK